MAVRMHPGFAEIIAEPRGVPRSPGVNPNVLLHCSAIIQRMRPLFAIAALLGIDAAQVKDVVITHLHYDHVGNFELFPAATLHLQELEMRYATGRYMCSACFSGAYEVEDVVGMVRRVYQGRVRFHDGATELAPGISLHLIGGHTMGLQAVRVATRRGALVLASDASHFYANMEEARPFPIVWSVADMLDGHERLRALAASPQHIIPGHDPLVMQRYKAPAPSLEGVVARLD